jgi:hypothetical protein
MTRTFILAAMVLTVLFGLPSCESKNMRRVSDPGFILVKREPSPDNRFALLIYKYDTGALGYSRLWWAVTPSSYDSIDLSEYELPDSYKAVGWSSSGELLVSKWHPHYYPQGDTTLTTGEFLHGLVVRVVEGS